MNKTLIGTAVALMLTMACANTSTANTSTISGQAFLKTRGGDVKFGAGNEVILASASEYIESYYREKGRIGSSGWRISQDPLNRELVSFMTTTIADAGGNFEFKNLPAGEYMLFCEIYWETGGGKTGGVAYAIVNIGNNEVKKVILTAL